MKAAKISGLLTALCATTLFTLAAPSERGPRGGHGFPPPSPILRALDANQDGVISKEEIAKASSLLAALDTDGDGVISSAELLPPPPPSGDTTKALPAPPADPLLTALDADGNGLLDAAEIAAAADSLAALDKNADGQLTREEIMPARPDHPCPSQTGQG